MTLVRNAFRTLVRTLLLLLLVAAATLLLMRFAPGYFTDAREMDAQYANSARTELQIEQSRHGSLRSLANSTLRGWLHRDLGVSRQYNIPVLELLTPRLAVTAPLLARGIACGWGIALAAALPLSAVRRGSGLLAAPFTVLLAVPTGALATLCLLSDVGGPAVVLMLLLAARDFKFLFSLLRSAWNAPHVISARAQGLRTHQLLRAYVLPNVLPQMLALASLSLVTALSAIVPLEVIFDVPGLGQLAWGAAMNRDLPVLLAITLLFASAISLAGMAAPRTRSLGPRIETA